MRSLNWLLRLLFLSGLSRASLGFEVSAVTLATTQAQSQPLSLDIDFFVQINQHEFKVPIMPLHLLGKKSWNVYNTANIEKVRKDEALAAAKEAAEEERMQALDAERRMQILRGEVPTPLAIEDAPASSTSKFEIEERSYGRERKRRKKAGENDTDFEMRVAREEAEDKINLGKQLVLRKESKSDEAPLVDERGHISLFPQEKEGLKKGDITKEKNAEVEKEKERKKKELEDQYTMRFSNAAGFKQSLGEKAWYEKGGRNREEEDLETAGKDVWGNEDPRRKERERERVVSSDPLAMMKAGARKVREVEKERKRGREEREREMREMEEAEARERRRKRKRGMEDEENDLENFRLDDDDHGGSAARRRSRDDSKDRERRHRHKESRRSSHREEGRHRHRHRHRRHSHD